MTTDNADARLLLQVAPDDYVGERTRLVKLARANGNRAAASFYQSLKRPNLSLWAVLAGGDAAAVHGIITATTELAKVQAGGSDAGVLTKATQHRRKALEAIVDAAAAALAQWEPVPEARRAEIRGIVDQLSRNNDVADAWIHGTLRELPDDAWGFGAFAGMEVTPASQSEAPRSLKTKGGDGRSAATASKAVAAPQRPSRVENAGKVREARNDVAAAKRDLVAAERRVQEARRALRDAEKEKRLADEAQASAERHVEAATARLESAQAD